MNNQVAKFLSVEEVAEILNYSQSQIRRLIKKGVIDAVKVNNGRKFLISKQFIEERS